MAKPTIESAQALMKHPGIRLLVVTGGPAVVKAAMNSGKRAIAAGPGNPPAVVDETAHLEQAARDIVDGASLDNNIVCIVEKEIFAVASIADQLKRELGRARRLRGAPEARRPAGEAWSSTTGTRRATGWARTPRQIAQAAGLEPPEGTRLLFAEVDPPHPFVQAELLMPVIGFSRLPTVEALHRRRRAGRARLRPHRHDALHQHRSPVSRWPSR